MLGGRATNVLDWQREPAKRAKSQATGGEYIEFEGKRKRKGILAGPIANRIAQT